jgi:hypothetical protein
MSAQSEAIIVSLPAIVKAYTKSETGQRIIEVEASNEFVDGQGDVIMQAALMGSAKSFVETGHIDIDHLSEIGDRLTPPIPNPSAYIIGRPLEVIDGGEGRTIVRCEIMRGADGSEDPVGRKYDEFWQSLQSTPPVAWRASIYGFPLSGMVETIKHGKDKTTGALRYIVKGIDWRSLAMTRNPVNTAIVGTARIVSAKSYIASVIAKSAGEPATLSPPDWFSPPRSLDELWGQYERHIARDCPHCGLGDGIGSVSAFKDHFQCCTFATRDESEILSHALMYLLAKERARR